MVTVTVAFRSWRKASTNMKLSIYASINRLNREGIADFNSLIEFDKDTILYLPKVLKEPIAAISANPVNNITATAEVLCANVSSITIQRLLVACRAAKYYNSIHRGMTTGTMHTIRIFYPTSRSSSRHTKRSKMKKPQKVNDKDGPQSSLTVRSIIHGPPSLMFLFSSQNTIQVFELILYTENLEYH